MRCWKSHIHVSLLPGCKNRQQGLYTAAPAPQWLSHRRSSPGAQAFGGRGRNLVFLTDSCLCPGQGPSHHGHAPTSAGQRSRALRPRLTDAAFPQPISLSEQAVPSLRFPSAGSGATFPFRLRVPERSGRPDRGSRATAVVVGLAMAELVQGQSAPVGMKAEGFVDALHRVRQVRAREAGDGRPPREASGGRLGPRVAGGPGGSPRRPGAGGSLSRALLSPAPPAAPTGLPSGVQIQAAPGGSSGVDSRHPSHALDVTCAALGNLVFHLLHFKHIGRNSRIFYI